MPKSASNYLLPARALLAIQAVLFIAYYGNVRHPITGAMMESRYRLNKRALEPVLQPLARAGIVQSQPGAYGGYYIADKKSVTLARIVDCFMADKQQELAFSHFSPLLFPALGRAYQQWHASLENITIADLCEQAEGLELPSIMELSLDYVI